MKVWSPGIWRGLARWALLNRFARNDYERFVERSELGPEYGRNQHAEPIQVAHSSLIKLSDESDFKVQCPSCAFGVLLVYRNQETLALRRDDRCICCAQRFEYTDAEIGGEALPQ